MVKGLPGMPKALGSLPSTRKGEPTAACLRDLWGIPEEWRWGHYIDTVLSLQESQRPMLGPRRCIKPGVWYVTIRPTTGQAEEVGSWGLAGQLV